MVEYADVVDLSTLGGVAVKGLFLDEREGHVPRELWRRQAGSQRHRAAGYRRPPFRRRKATAAAGVRNRRDRDICGSTIDEYVELARILSDAEGVAALELNISCPNIKEGGLTFGCSLDGTHAVVQGVRRVTSLPIIPKLTPNVTDVASFARPPKTRVPTRCRW